MKFYWSKLGNKLVVVKSTINGTKKVYYWTGTKTVMESIGEYSTENEAIDRLQLEPAQRSY